MSNWLQAADGTETVRERRPEDDMKELFLILHKVRGEPTFDIAIRITNPDYVGEDMWIIPTSGHRAYPYQRWPMRTMWHHSTNGEYVPALVDPPPDWPDHYSVNDRPLREETYLVKAKAAGLLQSLGLVKKVERRI